MYGDYLNVKKKATINENHIKWNENNWFIKLRIAIKMWKRKNIKRKKNREKPIQ